MGIFFKKQRQVEILLFRYLEIIQKAQKKFTEAFDGYLESRNHGSFDFFVQQTHKFESMADDIREEIKNLMYGKALLPESRGDIMGLVEAIDVVPGQFELILQMIKTQAITIPDFIVPDIRMLIQASMEACDFLFTEIKALFHGHADLRELVASIDDRESLCDSIERRIITQLFGSNLDPFQKLQLKELVVKIGDISDQADRVSKRANIIRMKRTM